MAEPMGTLEDAETCNRCGGENIRWAAPSPLWNKVMRDNDVNGEPRYRDLVCIRCFIVLAYEAGIDGTWRVTVDPEPEGLIYETPSGRVWDADSWLWKDPPLVRLIGGPHDGVMVGHDLPDVVHVGIRRARYEVVTDPDTGERLGGYVHIPDPLSRPGDSS